MRDWLVAADDRTGAFEVAALFAPLVGPVTVTVGDPPSDSGVVDLGSRAMTVDRAANLAAACDALPSRWVAHKIDSTLRGNWAAEIMARQRQSGRRIVVLPAWPDLGRTCVGGVVHVNGEPHSSILDHLPAATLLADVAQLTEWLDGDDALAVCDVANTRAMHEVAAVLAGADVLITGPAGSLGAVFAACLAAPSTAEPVPQPPIQGPVLVVCGSANDVSREQIRRLAAARPDVAIMATPLPDSGLRPMPAEALIAAARQRMAQLHPATLVLVGGDTAAGVLGVAPRFVGGFAAVGMPWSRDETGGGALVVTKAGGFGGPDALVELLGGETG